MTTLISGDTEISGPCPGLGDLIMFGCVVVEPGLTRSFASGMMRPECPHYEQSRYDFLGITRAQHEAAPYSIEERIRAFAEWVEAIGDPKNLYILLTDNPGVDHAWLTYEMHHKLGRSVLGHSARRIGDAWSGLRQRPRDTSGWHRYRVTPHDHDPANDSRANAEAWLTMWGEHGNPKEKMHHE